MRLRRTGNGIRIVKNIHEKHSLFAEFRKMIGVDKEVVHFDVEGIGHRPLPQTKKTLKIDMNAKESQSKYY